MGDLVAFTAIQARLLFPMAGLFMRGVQISSSIALFDRIFEYLDIDPKIKDPAQPVPVDPANFKGEIVYNGVGFRYSEISIGDKKRSPKDPAEPVKHRSVIC
jgi:ATP-binding cassette subfamily B protein